MSRRERYRQEATNEIKQLAMRQLARSGPAGISLSAIAKQMGMTGPALYRYFASRDALLTALIRDGYTDLAETAEARAAEAATLPPPERLRAVAHAIRDWALAEPQRYLLLFGTPVPGYAAPPDTLETAMRTLNVLSSIMGSLPPAVIGWSRMHGLISLQLIDQFAHLDLDPAELFEHELDAVVAENLH